MSTENLDSVKLGYLKKMIKTIEKAYKTKDKDEIKLSFEFLIGSLYPHVYHNIQDAIKREHTLGYIEGIAEREGYTFSQSKMNGNIKLLQKLHKMLESASGEISYMNNDAGFHGWEGDALKNEEEIHKALEEWLNLGMIIIEKGLGDNLNED